MGQAETYQMISLICFGLAGVFLIAATILFFKLRIVEVIGELTGRTARRQIQAYRKEADRKDASVPSDGEETSDMPQIFQAVEEKEVHKEPGETVLLIDSDHALGDEQTVLLYGDEEEEEQTAVMDNRFHIVRDEGNRSSEKVVS